MRGRTIKFDGVGGRGRGWGSGWYKPFKLKRSDLQRGVSGLDGTQNNWLPPKQSYQLTRKSLSDEKVCGAVRCARRKPCLVYARPSSALKSKTKCDDRPGLTTCTHRVIGQGADAWTSPFSITAKNKQTCTGLQTLQIHSSNIEYRPCLEHPWLNVVKSHSS